MPDPTEPAALADLKRAPRQVLDEARHIYRATEDNHPYGILRGDLLLFEAGGRPSGVFRTLEGATEQMYRLRYGKVVAEAIARNA